VAADLGSAIDAYHDAWNLESSTPFDRISAASRCVNLLGVQGASHRAATLAKEAIDFLPTMYTALVDHDDDQFAVQVYAGLAADACAVLLTTGQAEQALQYLERGRAIIISKLLDKRADISTLQIDHPGLAERYRKLVAELNETLLEPDRVWSKITLQEHRRDRMNQLQACINEIRAAEGHERFLLGQTVAEMQETAIGGHVVIVNVTEFRSDAIIISPTGIKAVYLRLDPAKLKMRAKSSTNGLARYLRSSRGPIQVRSDRETPRDGRLNIQKPNANGFCEFLEQLWLGCVKPVLEELGLWKRAGDKPLDRIWWIGTGLAHSLPFHAAGTHSHRSTDNTLSWAISSYLPSIRVLQHSRDNSVNSTSEAESLLLVTMTETPSHDKLPGVVVEAQKIFDTLRPPHSVHQLDRPCKDQVLSALNNCSMAHFACHGHADPWDPSKSCLIFQSQATSDQGEIQPPYPEEMTIRDIMDVHPSQRPRLAYLSACSTAQNNGAGLEDEQLHLASSFQVAGFRHVVASLWPAQDFICAHVAGIFYRELTITPAHRRGAESDRVIAEALHKAIVEVRRDHLERPYLWAQYIHSGA